MRPFKDFVLSEPHEVPDWIRGNYRLPGNPWGDGVQQFHLDKLPLVDVTYATSVPCAYCRNPITRFNSEIDHVIPVKQYARYKAYCANPEPTSQDQVDRLCEAAHSDAANLLLACVPCNQGKKYKVHSAEELRAYAKAFGKFLGKNDAYQKLINAASVTVQMANHAQARAILKDIATRGDRANVYSDFQKSVQNTTVRLFTRGRPAFTVSWETLAHEQGWIAYDFQGRYCPYCLGIYHSGFELDHIKAKVGATPTLQHNNPKNLIMCCASCNSSKGTYFVSRFFLDTRIRERQLNGIPGAELQDPSKNLLDSRADQDRIFGL